ncbi:MAG: hypothetical protein HQ578_02415 [Chloroflexi bacterium]|nr:hypothetical protein [Chloroflexota bacterium]
MNVAATFEGVAQSAFLLMLCEGSALQELRDEGYEASQRDLVEQTGWSEIGKRFPLFFECL